MKALSSILVLLFHSFALSSQYDGVILNRTLVLNWTGHPNGRLLLNEREIKSIDKDTFASLDYVKELNLQKNKIEEIDALLFNGMYNLEWLDLSMNRIRHLHPKTFDGLEKLKVLMIGYNQLETLDPMVFKNVVNLSFLSLSGNKLKRLEPNIFDSLVNIKILDLSKNQLEVIDSRIFNELKKLHTLHLIGNNLVKLDVSTLRLPTFRHLSLDKHQLALIDQKDFQLMLKNEVHFDYGTWFDPKNKNNASSIAFTTSTVIPYRHDAIDNTTMTNNTEVSQSTSPTVQFTIRVTSTTRLDHSLFNSYTTTKNQSDPVITEEPMDEKLFIWKIKNSTNVAKNNGPLEQLNRLCLLLWIINKIFQDQLN
jgi:Leucine-rich repeat (LRR) protein